MRQDERVKVIAASIDLFMQKYRRLEQAKLNAMGTDSYHMEFDETQKALRHAENNYTAAKYALAESIVNGEQAK